MAILKLKDENGNIIDIPSIRGKSAYEYAQEGGYTGTEADFIKDLAESGLSDIIDNLTTNASDKPLSAKQGVQLKALIDAIVVPTKTSQLTNDKKFITETELNNKAYATNTQFVDLKAQADNLDDDLRDVENDIDNHKKNTSIHIVYGVCDTAADVADKTVTVENNFALKEGATVIIRFVNANSIAAPTLNVNETGAKPMYRYGTTTLSTGTTTTGWIAGAIQMFTYNGTGWIRDYWNNTTYSNASLGCGYATCSTAEATVAKTATLSSYSLTTGGMVAVKFTNAVPAKATLNINSKGAKNIYYRGAAITADVIKAGDIATFVYSSQYHLISIDRMNTEEWTFTLEDGSTVTKKVVLA